ncbi:class I SAM-dependent rRNA methyltransferase [Marinilabiliaceae bacterium ANBcel2]|nr:class I SAM-dependent rRNA methyltransferase [Marinilabiliaceae bacterium ANBcel2]
MEIPIINLKAGKEQSLKRYHPWIFSGAIKNVEGELQEGDVVIVHDNSGNFIGKGHYQIGSIAVRMLTFKNIEIDYTFFEERLKSALKLRKIAGLTDNDDTTAYRLVYGEGDRLPGLIVDIYGDTAVMQMHTVAMYRVKSILVKAIQSIFGDSLKAIYDKSEGTLPYKSAVEPCNGYLIGRSQENVAFENGLKFYVDWEKGQKTGFFIDQRENRRLLEQYSNDRTVLNMFCYTGGFSFYALRGGANLVHSVDSSERAVDLTSKNVELNFPGDSRHKSFAQDAYKFMETCKESYNLIILDPPAFAKHLKVVKNALKGYRKFNAKALEIISSGGILFTFSCSQVISMEAFRTMVFSAAAKSGRNIRVIHQLSQPADHPVSIYHPEGEYLKGLVLYVE